MAGSNILHLAAGGVGSTAGVCITYPLDVLQTRLQSTVLNFSQYSSSSTSNSFASGTALFNQNKVGTSMGLTSNRNYLALVLSYMRFMIRTEGVLSLYKGLLPSILGIAPAKAVYFLAYSGVKRQLNESGIFKQNSKQIYTISAMFSGLVTSTITNPVWFVKTQLQLESKSLGIIECIRNSYNDQGIRAFFKGLSASYVGILETVIYFVIYEDTKRKLKAYRIRNNDTKQFYKSDVVIASVTSKLMATLMMYPHEVVRIRLRENLKDKNGKVKYKSFFQALRYIAAEEGRAGLYGGFATSIIRQIPNTAVTFLIYETIVNYFSK